jgi:hypothetical protein
MAAALGSTSALAKAPPGRYTFDTAGVVYDTLTKLSWQRELPSSYSPSCAAGTDCTAEEAKTYCSKLSLGGMTGWRLPTRAELLTIADRTETDPAIDREAFPGTPSDWFWTSSPRAGSSGNVWHVYFDSGSSYYNGTSYANRVRCVR